MKLATHFGGLFVVIFCWQSICQSQSDAHIAEDLTSLKARVCAVIPAEPTKDLGAAARAFQELPLIEKDILDTVEEYLAVHSSFAGLDALVEGFFLPLPVPDGSTNSKLLFPVAEGFAEVWQCESNRVALKYRERSLGPDRVIWMLQVAYGVPGNRPYTSPVYVILKDISSVFCYPIPPDRRPLRRYPVSLLGFIPCEEAEMPKVCLLEYGTGQLGRFDVIIWSFNEASDAYGVLTGFSGHGYLRSAYDHETSVFTYWLGPPHADEATRYSVDIPRFLSGEEQAPTSAE